MRARLVCAFVLATVFCVTVTFATAAEPSGALQLPRSLYKSIAGGWNVDLYSPCGTHVTGTVTFANETAAVRWDGQEAELLLTPFEDSKAMDMSGLLPYVTEEAAGAGTLTYRVCERLENTVDTPRRPGFGAAMRTTYLYDYAGSFESTQSDACLAAATRPVHIRTMGHPLVTALFTSEQKGQVQYMEMSVDVSALPRACTSKQPEESVTPPRDTQGVRGRRKRGATRQAAVRQAGLSSAETVDTCVSRGVLTIRFAMSTPPPKTTLQRAAPILVFICMFIILRIVYGYSSSKAAGSVPPA